MRIWLLFIFIPVIAFPMRLPSCSGLLLPTPLTLHRGAFSIPGASRTECSHSALHCEMGRFHGRSILQARSQGRLLPGNPKYWIAYVRDADAFTDFPDTKTYLDNAVDGHRAFKTWWTAWLGGRTETFETWKENLKRRHTIASGMAKGTPHLGPNAVYRSDQRFPGSFRSEVFPDKIWDHYCPVATLHTRDWLQAHGYRPKFILSSRREVRELEELAAQRKRDLKRDSVINNTADKVVYAEPNDLDLLLELAWKRLNEIKEGILLAHRFGMNETLRNALVDSIADYFHTSMYAHFFVKVNFSLLMSEVNTILEEIGLPAVRHGYLDLVSVRMDYLPFREYFREFLEHMQQENRMVP